VWDTRTLDEKINEQLYPTPGNHDMVFWRSYFFDMPGLPGWWMG
jgi:hypothetical protein